MSETNDQIYVETTLREDAIYVHGHVNPDTDSITSAITYAYLKNKEDSDHHYQAVRLGDLNRETQFVLDYYGIATPPYLKHVRRRVAEAMVKDVIFASKDISLYEAGTFMEKKNLRALPLINDENKAVGIVTERALSRYFLREFHTLTLKDTPLTVAQITRTLKGRIISGAPEMKLTGHPLVGAMSPEKMAAHIQPGDILLIGDRPHAQRKAIEKQVACLIITGDLYPDRQIIAMAKEHHTAIILTPFTTFVAGRLLRLSVSAYAITDRSFFHTTKETLLSEFEPELMQDQNGVALVIDDAAHLEGVITRHDLIHPRRRRIILVDHSEKSQSVEGIEDAEILEIVDHHRLGGLETGQPIFAYVKPVGCTATLIWQRYQELGIEPPQPIAGLLVAAILSDTMLLRSPTTTPEDVETLEELQPYLPEDPMTFGIEMYNAKTNLAGIGITDLINSDSKVFHFSQNNVQISQIEVVDHDPLLQRREEIREALQQQRAAKGLDLFILAITNVLEEGSYLIVAGNEKLVERAYGIRLENGMAYLPGVMSRKKQIVPPLANVA